MCGIAGTLAPTPLGQAALGRMTDALRHRGPDDDGLWLGAEGRVAFGHRRLAIIDLSPGGRQPMTSRDGRYTLAYNGEIYNYEALRREVEAAGAPTAWRGHSDTEVLVEAIALWGVEAAVRKCVGMFAFSLWDEAARVLTLARDRFGEKPLYYGRVGGRFAWASELKALRTLDGFDASISRQALGELLRRGYVPAPLSIYESIHKLEPGCLLTVPLDAIGQAGPPTPYWSYGDVVRTGLAQPYADENEAVEALEGALADAIRAQAVADVPVGAFLSGGIDSSLVVALYRKHTTGTVRTFSIGFEQAAYNEAPHAAAVARHLGTEHHERIVTVREARDVIPLLPAIYDEPFADSSQIPTYLVSRFAREQVTVALSGDGGDELFGGYNRHIAARRYWARARALPGPVRAAAGAALGAVPPTAWNALLRLAPGRRPAHIGFKAQRAFRALGRARDLEGLFSTFVDFWPDGVPVLGASPPMGFDLLSDGAPDATRLMHADAVSYLPDDILVKVDRAAMAVSLETRVPFLDHRVAEVAARIPEALKIEGGTGKRILRSLLFREAPPALFERPKAGFAVPVAEWLRGPLRGWADDLLSPDRLRAEGYLDPAPITRRWRAHLRGEEDATSALWPVLMFESWLDENGTAGPALVAAPERAPEPVG